MLANGLRVLDQNAFLMDDFQDMFGGSFIVSSSMVQEKRHISVQTKFQAQLLRSSKDGGKDIVGMLIVRYLVFCFKE
jgi:hypothetical protein